jgi:hypothetical protein
VSTRVHQSVRLFQQVLEIAPHYALLAAALPGFVLFVGSYLLNLDHVSAPATRPFVGPYPTGTPEYISREVGYVPTLNWSLTYLLLFPAALYFKITALQGTARALNHFHRRRMWRDASGNPVLKPIVTQSWIEGNPLRTVFLLTFGGVLPIIYSLGEWFPNNFLRLWHGWPPRGWPKADYPDYDWGLSGIMFQWGLGHRMVNAAFDLFAFCCEGLLIACTFVFFLLLLDLGRVLLNPGNGQGLVLIPDLSSTDVRRGFEVFSEPLQQMLLSALLSYIICYLVRLEGLYMNGVGRSSLVDFLAEDNTFEIVQKVFTDPKVLPTLIPGLLTTGPDSFRGVLAWTVSGLISLICVVVVVMTIRAAAKDAQSFALEHFAATDAGPLCDGKADEERDRARTMETWPLAYLQINALIALALLGFATLYFYRIGIYFVLLSLIALLTRTTKSVLGLSTAPQRPDRGGR